jgi:hypothetical protein
MATNTSPSTDSKGLNPNLSWAFAAAAAVVGAVVVFALNPIKDYKVIFGATAVASMLLAGASTFLTPAKTLGVIGKFALAGIAVAVCFFMRGHSLVTSTVDKVADSVGATVNSGDTGVGGLAKFIGSAGGVFAFFLVLFGAIAGAVIGSRLRSGKGYGLIPARR